MTANVRHVPLSLVAREIQRKIEERAKQNVQAQYVNVGINSAEGIKSYGEGPANIATIAQYLEYGWVQSVTKRQSGWFARDPRNLGVPPGSVLFMPPRPFLRATLRHKADEWVEIVKRAYVEYNGDLEKVLARVGMAAVADIQNTIATGGVDGEQFPRRSPLTMLLYEIYRQEGKNKGDGSGGSYGDKPLFNTGRLHGSISFELVR